ncbi:MAG: RdgB/HAM1 family non-canonical purine NTP pyrophosphatase [Actinomycetota bacterium]
MTARLVLATTNVGKVAELRDILTGLDVELLDAGAVDLPDGEETGETFAANAVLKATACAAAVGLPCVADDSGLAVDVLDGAPGVYSARYAGPQRDDDANLQLVLERTAGEEAPTARFVCAAALALPDGTVEVVEGIMEGTIVRPPRGTYGFGYDPIFQPRGHDLTSAEMAPADKHAISHRGKAFRTLRPRIAALLAGQSSQG